MLHDLTITEDFRCFKKDEKFEFRPGINFLVGDQGCGKSTLIQLIRSTISPLQKQRCKITADPITCLSKDFEKENPRIQKDLDESNQHQFNIGLRSMFSSHGEVVMAFIRPLRKIKEPTLLIVDEPDMALSIRSIFEMIRIFDFIVEQKGQVIAAVHNPLLIQDRDVLSVADRKWMPGNEFIEKMKKKKK